MADRSSDDRGSSRPADAHASDHLDEDMLDMVSGGGSDLIEDELPQIREKG